MSVAKSKLKRRWPKWFEVWFKKQWDMTGSWDEYAAMLVAWSAYCKGKRNAR